MKAIEVRELFRVKMFKKHNTYLRQFGACIWFSEHFCDRVSERFDDISITNICVMINKIVNERFCETMFSLELYQNVWFVYKGIRLIVAKKEGSILFRTAINNAGSGENCAFTRCVIDFEQESKHE